MPAAACLQLFRLVFPEAVRQRHRQLLVGAFACCHDHSASCDLRLHLMQSPQRGRRREGGSPDSPALHWSIIRYCFLDLHLPMRLYDVPAIKVNITRGLQQPAKRHSRSTHADNC